MKKFKYIFLVTALSVLGLSSCTDFLDVKPHDGVESETALQTISDYKQQLNDCYSTMGSEYYWGGQLILLPDVMSDNLILCDAGRQTYNEYFSFKQKSTTYGTENLWSTAYNVILGANQVITRLGETNEFASTPDSAASFGVLAEAYLIRAMVHFDLARLYGKRYDPATAASEKAVPYKTNIDPMEKPSRKTVKQVYDLVLRDMDKAEALFKRAGKTTAYNGTINHKFNLKSFYAIKSRVLLSMAGTTTDLPAWNAVITAALGAVKGDGTDMGLLPTSTAQNFAGIYFGKDGPTDNNGEVLFRLAILDTDNRTPGNFYSQGARNEYCISYSFNAMYIGTDCRSIYFRQTDAYSGINYNGVSKWRGRDRSRGPYNVTDIIMVRTSELYLTLAEAYYNIGDETNAKRCVDYIRKARYANYSATTLTGNALYQLIMSERRLDLAFEGHRLFDLKRLNLPLARDNKGDQASGAGVQAAVQSLPAGDNGWVIPIPEGEINANPNINN